MTLAGARTWTLALPTQALITTMYNTGTSLLKVPYSFDDIVSFTSTKDVLFGMVAAPSDRNRGIWRSTDGGATWTRVLEQPQIDFAFALPSGDLLAFQWGVHVWRSSDGGRTWTKYGDA